MTGGYAWELGAVLHAAPPLIKIGAKIIARYEFFLQLDGNLEA
jgi:hypothetical protein